MTRVVPTGCPAENGFDAYVIHGGLRAWTKAGNPLEPVPSDDLVLLPTFT